MLKIRQQIRNQTKPNLVLIFLYSLYHLLLFPELLKRKKSQLLQTLVSGTYSYLLPKIYFSNECFYIYIYIYMVSVLWLCLELFMYRIYKKFHIIQQVCSIYVYVYIDLSGYIYKETHILCEYIYSTNGRKLNGQLSCHSLYIYIYIYTHTHTMVEMSRRHPIKLLIIFLLLHKFPWKFVCGTLIQAIGLMSRVFANGSGDRGSILGRVIPKTQKNGTSSPTPWCSSYRKGSLRVTLD